MTHEDTVPVLVGISQLEQRVADPALAKEPLDLMIDAVRAAAADAGSDALLRHATSVRVIRGIWPYRNPARIVAQAVDIPNAETCLTPYGGNFVQTTFNQSALDIQSGRHDVIVLTGAECGYTQARARKQKVELQWRDAPGTPDRLIGEDKNMRHDAEKAAGLGQPIQLYPMFENALRHARGERIAEHLERISQLWSRFSEVASHNPHAWIREHVDARQIRTPSAANRPVSFPYPKLMNSNNNVDQAAALIVCSVSAGAAFRHSAGSLGLSVGGHRRARPLLRVESRQPLHVAGDPLRRQSLPRTRRPDGRVARPRRSLQLLSGGRAGRSERTRSRRRSAADGDRRFDVRRWSAEQLRDAFDRADGGGPARGPRCERPRDRRTAAT